MKIERRQLWKGKYEWREVTDVDVFGYVTFYLINPQTGGTRPPYNAICYTVAAFETWIAEQGATLGGRNPDIVKACKDLIDLVVIDSQQAIDRVNYAQEAIKFYEEYSR
jgi:hypothetical protein